MKSGKPSLREAFVASTTLLRDSTVPRRGPRVFVRGKGVNEEMLREKFSTVGGTIVNINMEPNRRSVIVPTHF